MRENEGYINMEYEQVNKINRSLALGGKENKLLVLYPKINTRRVSVKVAHKHIKIYIFLQL